MRAIPFWEDFGAAPRAVAGRYAPVARSARTAASRPMDLAPGPGKVSGAPLASLAGGALAGRFHAWRGVSGRRYVFCVFPASAHDLPDFEDALLIAAAVDGAGRRRIVRIGEAGRLPQVTIHAFAARARAAGATEVHVHLSPGAAEARLAVLRDLRPGAPDSFEIGGEPGERAVFQPELQEMLVGGPDVVGVVS
jgi:hypothetical protein